MFSLPDHETIEARRRLTIEHVEIAYQFLLDAAGDGGPAVVRTSKRSAVRLRAFVP